jgi:hypothetical protein
MGNIEKYIGISITTSYHQPRHKQDMERLSIVVSLAYQGTSSGGCDSYHLVMRPTTDESIMHNDPELNAVYCRKRARQNLHYAACFVAKATGAPISVAVKRMYDRIFDVRTDIISTSDWNNIDPDQTFIVLKENAAWRPYSGHGPDLLQALTGWMVHANKLACRFVSHTQTSVCIDLIALGDGDDV